MFSEIFLYECIGNSIDKEKLFISVISFTVSWQKENGECSFWQSQYFKLTHACIWVLWDVFFVFQRVYETSRLWGIFIWCKRISEKKTGQCLDLTVKQSVMKSKPGCSWDASNHKIPSSEAVFSEKKSCTITWVACLFTVLLSMMCLTAVWPFHYWMLPCFKS